MSDTPSTAGGSLTPDAEGPAELEGAANPTPSTHPRWERHREHVAGYTRLRRRVTRSAIALGLLIVLLLGGGAIFVSVELGKIQNIDVSGLTPQGKADDILLVGSTSRCAVTSSAQKNLFQKECAAGVNGVNSDVIMILRLVPGRPPALLSIPRDTFVPNARYGGLYNKVDAALANGPSQLVGAIQQDFGIPINHYVVLNFGTFENIVSALGGISMYFPTTLRDFSSDLSIDRTGCVHISGTQALALVRSRHLYFHYSHKKKTWLGYDPTGDIGRIERVHLFLRALASEVSARGLSNPITDSKLLAAVAPDLTVDNKFSTRSMLDLVLQYHSSVGNSPQYTLPVVEDNVAYMYKGYNYGLVVFPTEPEDQQTIDKFLGAGFTPRHLPTAKITVSVVDGTNSAARTTATASSLSSLGYKVLGSGSKVSVGPVSETTVVYSSSAHLLQAEQVKHTLKGLVVLGQAATTDGADVTVITGTNFTVNAPPAKSVTKTASATSLGSPTSSRTTVLATLVSAILDAAVTLSANAALSAPTTATSSIPPFDPRVCPNFSAKK